MIEEAGLRKSASFLFFFVKCAKIAPKTIEYEKIGYFVADYVDHDFVF